MKIHESSPAGVSSLFIKQQCKAYLETQYWPSVASGTVHESVRCENLEDSTFADESFDLVITQDVLEHILHPDKAFADIHRTLKTGGCHLFTVPLYQRDKTLVRAVEEQGKLVHLHPPEYHGNPIDPNGSLVVREWGYDLPDYIFRHTGMMTTILSLRDRRRGFDGEFLDVVISCKR